MRLGGSRTGCQVDLSDGLLVARKDALRREGGTVPARASTFLMGEKGRTMADATDKDDTARVTKVWASMAGEGVGAAEERDGCWAEERGAALGRDRGKRSAK